MLFILKGTFYSRPILLSSSCTTLISILTPIFSSGSIPSHLIDSFISILLSSITQPPLVPAKPTFLKLSWPLFYQTLASFTCRVFTIFTFSSFSISTIFFFSISQLTSSFISKPPPITLLTQPSSSS